MKKLIPVLVVSFVGFVNAGDLVGYSTDEYCEQERKFKNNSVLHETYAKAYAEKLGKKPSELQCNKSDDVDVKSVVSNNTAKRWTFKGNRMSKNSVIRLPIKTVADLRRRNISFVEYL